MELKTSNNEVIVDSVTSLSHPTLSREPDQLVMELYFLFFLASKISIISNFKITIVTQFYNLITFSRSWAKALLLLVVVFQSENISKSKVITRAELDEIFLFPDFLFMRVL